MKFLAILVLLGATSAEDEMLDGSEECGEIDVIEYSDADCTKSVDVQSRDSILAGLYGNYDLENDVNSTLEYTNSWKCHFEGLIISKSTGEQQKVFQWDKCYPDDEQGFVKLSSSTTYGGYPKANPCDFNEDFKEVIYRGEDCAIEY